MHSLTSLIEFMRSSVASSATLSLSSLLTLSDTGLAVTLSVDRGTWGEGEEKEEEEREEEEEEREEERVHIMIVVGVVAYILVFLFNVFSHLTPFLNNGIFIIIRF